MCESWNWFFDYYYTILNATDPIRMQKEIEIEQKSNKNSIRGLRKGAPYLYLVVSWAQFSTIFYYAINDHVFVSEQSLFMFDFYGKIITDFCPSVFSILHLLWYRCWMLSIENKRRDNAHDICIKYMLDFQPASSKCIYSIEILCTEWHQPCPVESVFELQMR